MNRAMRRAGFAQLRATRKEWTPWEKSNLDPVAMGYPAMWRMAYALKNNRYAVLVFIRSTAWGEVTHLAIGNPESTEPPWRDLQRIKTELFGPERVAIQVYPAESELVDKANMYHLWVLPDGFCLPFTLQGEW